MSLLSVLSPSSPFLVWRLWWVKVSWTQGLWRTPCSKKGRYASHLLLQSLHSQGVLNKMNKERPNKQILSNFLKLQSRRIFPDISISFRSARTHWRTLLQTPALKRTGQRMNMDELWLAMRVQFVSRRADLWGQCPRSFSTSELLCVCAHIVRTGIMLHDIALWLPILTLSSACDWVRTPFTSTATASSLRS